jgi:hypothetical protein
MADFLQRKEALASKRVLLPEIQSILGANNSSDALGGE